MVNPLPDKRPTIKEILNNSIFSDLWELIKILFSLLKKFSILKYFFFEFIINILLYKTDLFLKKYILLTFSLKLSSILIIYMFITFYLKKIKYSINFFISN